MINRDSHLLKGWEMEQIGHTAWIDENPMHIKTVNTHSQYECVIVWCDDPCRVNRWKGYRASIGRTAGTSPRLLMTFTLALIEAARIILLLCFLD